jgi:hypothetical protein
MAKVTRVSRLAVVTPEQYSPRRLNGRWKAVLEPILSDSRRLALEDCGSLHRLWRCKKNPDHERVTRIGCKDPLCYVCSSSKKAEQVADKMEILDRVYGELHEEVSSSMFTFTTPSDMWDRIGEDPEAMAKLERIVIRVLSRCLDGQRSISVPGQKRVSRYVVGGDVVGQWFHSHHSDNVGNVWRGYDAHVHALVYSLMYDRLYEVYGVDGLSKGAFVRRTLSLSRGEVRQMCYELGRKWKAEVEAEYGQSSQPVWVVNYRYYPRRHDVEFCLGYAFRSEVQEAYREVVWNGCAPRNEGETEWFRRMLSVRGRGKHRYSGFGWMANAVLNKYAVRIGVQFKPKADRLKERRKVFCDRCGSEMVSSWFDRPLSVEEVVSRGLAVLVVDRRREGG